MNSPLDNIDGAKAALMAAERYFPNNPEQERNCLLRSIAHSLLALAQKNA